MIGAFKVADEQKTKTIDSITVKISADTSEVEASLVRLSEFADELREKFDSLMKDVEAASKSVHGFAERVSSESK